MNEWQQDQFFLNNMPYFILSLDHCGALKRFAARFYICQNGHFQRQHLLRQIQTRYHVLCFHIFDIFSNFR